MTTYFCSGIFVQSLISCFLCCGQGFESKKERQEEEIRQFGDGKSY